MNAFLGYGLLIIAILIGAVRAPETTAWVAGIGFWAFVGFGVWYNWRERRKGKRNNKL